MKNIINNPITYLQLHKNAHLSNIEDKKTYHLPIFGSSCNIASDEQKNSLQRLIKTQSDIIKNKNISGLFHIQDNNHKNGHWVSVVGLKGGNDKYKFVISDPFINDKAQDNFETVKKSIINQLKGTKYQINEANSDESFINFSPIIAKSKEIFNQQHNGKEPKNSCGHLAFADNKFIIQNSGKILNDEMDEISFDKFPQYRNNELVKSGMGFYQESNVEESQKSQNNKKYSAFGLIKEGFKNIHKSSDRLIINKLEEIKSLSSQEMREKIKKYISNSVANSVYNNKISGLREQIFNNEGDKELNLALIDVYNEEIKKNNKNLEKNLEETAKLQAEQDIRINGELKKIESENDMSNSFFFALIMAATPFGLINLTGFDYLEQFQEIAKDTKIFEYLSEFVKEIPIINEIPLEISGISNTGPVSIIANSNLAISTTWTHLALGGSAAVSLANKYTENKQKIEYAVKNTVKAIENNKNIAKSKTGEIFENYKNLQSITESEALARANKKLGRNSDQANTNKDPKDQKLSSQLKEKNSDQSNASKDQKLSQQLGAKEVSRNKFKTAENNPNNRLLNQLKAKEERGAINTLQQNNQGRQ